ncbi:dUTP diphosphatase [uncultured Thomasclavelia sp.]|uniref:dUTP diphosphatase n=1 Tax=uncultured Thomasclavelia sp. TaxID=3025759 RepID=UPI0025FBAD74|nr:dUTP diphosphatase [uncultured Thomasclavelia sp.]
MNEINKIYQQHVSHELKLVSNPDHAVLNKDKVTAKVLAFLCELGKVGEEAHIFSFWDHSSTNDNDLLDSYLDALHMLMSIGFELHVDNLKNYQEINDPISSADQLIKVYHSALKINETYTFEAFQNCVDDYFTLGFKIGINFDAILEHYLQES